MPVYIDTFDTEIDLAPGKPEVERPAAPAASPNALPAATAGTRRESILCVLEAELDRYLRMRG